MTGGPADEARRALREARERREAEERGFGRSGSADEGLGEPVRRAAPVEGAAGEQGAAEDPAVSGTAEDITANPTVPVSSADPEQQATAQEPERREARPGDAARAALRGALSGRRGDTDADGDLRRVDTAHAEADPATPASAGGAVPPTGAPDEDADRRGDAATTTPGAGGGARPADRVREALRAARAEERRNHTDDTVGGARSRRTTPPAPAVRGGTGGRTAAERARAVRELAADAFRMPDDGEEAVGRDTGSTAGRPPWSASVDEAADQGSSAERDPAPVRTSQDAGPATTLQDTSPPAAPRHPRSMAAPGRDGELRRTFPAFAPRATDGDGGFAETWWGNAWVDALERGALDAKRLARGRGYAEQGHVDAITVTPGLVLAYVQGSRPRPYRVQVRLRTLDDADWDRFLDAAAERTGHIAALLDKEMPHALAEGGVPLLPGPGDLEPQCSCPDRGHPCKHAAALCYQTARLLDADPFVLLLLRGRGERELLDTLSRLSAARAARAAQEKGPAPLPGVRATEALAPRRLPPLPAPLPVPPHPEQPPVYPAAPGGPDPFALDQLATDAAGRAHALLSTGRDPVAELTLWQDAVRLAAARPGSGLTAATRSLYASLAAAADRTPADLARAVAAWRQGGFEGLAVLEEPWDPPAGRFDRARPLLLAADLPAFRPWRNRLTHPRGHVQLRLGRDGLWYAYESDPGADDWWPRGTPDLDPVGALTGLGASPEG
ncbi:SWIM zinc finger family protein [Streptomyces sp. NPDC001536]|uniref:SWIM zinc finger family protein n=1 Tax=Streptomyces sp. NPDC001536 TaxID=3364583 RepID=UPI00369CCE11